MRKILLFITILMMASHVTANPFLSGKGSGMHKSSKEETVKSGQATTQGIFIEKIKAWQRVLKENITDYFDKIKERNFHYIFMALIASIVYGMLHAIGPGHGKITLSSYVLARNISTGKTVWMGFLSGFAHAMSSLILISVIIAVFHSSILQNFEAVQNNLTNISFAIVAAIGFIILLNFIRNRLSKKDSSMEEVTALRAAPVIISAGIIPCPGAAIILIFSYTMGMYLMGIICVLAMSMGMGLTIGLSAAVVSVAKNRSGIRPDSDKLSQKIHTALEITGGTILLSIGISWFI